MSTRNLAPLSAAFFLATAFLLVHTSPSSAQEPALVYDTDFAIVYAPGDKVEHDDGTVTFSFDFLIRNDTGGAVSNVTVELSSPLVHEQETGTVAVEVIATDATASAAGSFTLQDPGIEDNYFLMSVLWRVEYDAAAGGHRKCYIKGSY